MSIMNSENSTQNGYVLDYLVLIILIASLLRINSHA